MDAKEQLNRKYANTAIYTSAFYADPDDPLNNRTKLFEGLKSFVMNQHEDTPFSLQVMTTNSEINIMPLGLVDLDELKAYEKEQRQKRGLFKAGDEIPLVVKFIPHVKDEEVKQEVVTTTQELFTDFNATFPKVWAVVNEYLRANQILLEALEADLVSDAVDVQKEYLANFTQMSAKERETVLGFELKDDNLDHFATFMADMHEVQAIVLSAASFSTKELLGENRFAEVMNDNVRRSTFFWVLDNTFYEVFYYFLTQYGTDNPKLSKHLRHQKATLISNMRNDAFERAQKEMSMVDSTIDFNKYFSDVYIPVAEQLAAEVDKFSGGHV
jgi:hypothetical protein